MSRPRKRSGLVYATKHAHDQYRARGGQGNLQRIIEGHLYHLLREGVTTTGNLLVEVPISSELKALCTPGHTGGWLCITVLERDWQIA